MKSAKESNGMKKDLGVSVYPELAIICKHCREPIDEANLRGFSLICPLCGKPQNGHQEI